MTTQNKRERKLSILGCLTSRKAAGWAKYARAVLEVSLTNGDLETREILSKIEKSDIKSNNSSNNKDQSHL